MITTTSLKHPTMRRKIIAATIHVLRDKYSVEHVQNADGVPVLAIRERNGSVIVTDRFNRDVTKQVAEAL